MITDAAAQLHQASIVIDGTCPLLRRREFVDWYIEGGVTTCCPTVGSTAGAGETLRNLGAWKRFIGARADLTQVFVAADIERAKADRKLGLVFHFQGADPIENDLDLVEAYHALGVRMVQLTYNVRNRVGDGCEEPADAGLSAFGVDLIKRLNDNRIVVDCSHTGYRTTMDAIARSSRPCVFSHANAYGLHPSPRNIKDDQIKAAAASGGLVGVNGFAAFLGDSARPSMDRYLEHIDYMVQLAGIDHVALAIDYYEGMYPVADAGEAAAFFKQQLAQRRWSAASYPPPPHHYPSGMATPRELPNLTRGLLARGYARADVRKVIGGNWQRLFRAVWGA
ncbi:MAG: dipeptidase [Burkholderiales bacterium]|nr:dipeptidase [Burkholderiales bacterium]